MEWAALLEKSGVGEIMINAIDRDGTWLGYDEELISKVASAVSIPVVACGGAGSFNDFEKAVHAGASAVAAGSFFVFQKKRYGRTNKFPEKKIKNFLSFPC